MKKFFISLLVAGLVMFGAGNANATFDFDDDYGTTNAYAETSAYVWPGMLGIGTFNYADVNSHDGTDPESSAFASHDGEGYTTGQVNNLFVSGSFGCINLNSEAGGETDTGSKSGGSHGIAFVSGEVYQWNGSMASSLFSSDTGSSAWNESGATYSAYDIDSDHFGRYRDADVYATGGADAYGNTVTGALDLGSISTAGAYTESNSSSWGSQWLFDNNMATGAGGVQHMTGADNRGGSAGTFGSASYTYSNGSGLFNSTASGQGSAYTFGVSNVSTTPNTISTTAYSQSGAQANN